MRLMAKFGLGAALVLSCACGRPAATASLASAPVTGQLRTDVAPDAATQYPIVLLHGFLGFDKILFIDYFYHVRSELEAAGFSVFAAQVSPVNTVEFRARQLALQIDAILAQTGATKVNLIAHSMGGLDARQLISSMGYGDRVASLSTIATPHLGSPIAEILYPILGGHSRTENAMLTLLGMDAQGPVVNTFDPRLIDLPGALWNLSETFARDYFAPAHPDDARVYYQSWGGDCRSLDIKHPDWLTAAFAVLTDVMRIGAGNNDGLVPVDSARHGVYRGTLAADHIDEVGQLFGHEAFGFDYQEFYLKMARDLAQRGF